MTCRECELWLAGCEGEMPEAVRDHLGSCAGCRAMQIELAENAQALGALREEALPAVRRVKRGFPWISVAAAAAVLAIASVQVWQWRPTPPRPLRLKAEEPQEMTVTVKAPPLPPVSRAPRPQAIEPLKIKMLTSDPDVVVYWLVDSKGDSKEGN